jgi:hypothetical protein
MKNWLNFGQVMVLSFMEEAISIIGFGATITDGDYTKRLQADINTCADAELPELRKVAEARDTEIQDIKAEYARSFEVEVTQLRNTGHTQEAFTELWLSRFHKNPAA